MSTATTKTVRVCLRGRPKSADQCTPVDLDLGTITGWGDPPVTTLAAALEIDPATVTSVWLREGDDDDEPDRIDKKKRVIEARWQKLLSAEPHHVLLLGVTAANPAADTAAPVPVRGLDHDVVILPEEEQNCERSDRLFRKEPCTTVRFWQGVSRPKKKMGKRRCIPLSRPSLAAGECLGAELLSTRRVLAC